MRVAVIQSNYLPWKGYFDIINDVDLFVFYDDVQFTRNDWRNRNRIKTPNGLKWLTVPCGPDISRLIHEVRLDSSKWQEKHFNQIAEAYKQSPYFARYEPFWRQIYREKTWQSLSELNQTLVRRIMGELLGVTRQYADSRQYELTGRGAPRLLSLLQQVGATSYVTGPSAANYLNEQMFRERGIELIWKDYNGYPEYPQLYRPFEQQVSIIDLLFNTGPAAPQYIWGWRSK
ncbi:MAG: WbqC family protein [Candidatus Margulisiibacteriota bacterium]